MINFLKAENIILRVDVNVSMFNAKRMIFRSMKLKRREQNV